MSIIWYIKSLIIAVSFIINLTTILALFLLIYQKINYMNKVN